MLRDHNFAVVGELLVSNTQVRHLLTGQVLRTFAPPGRLFVNTVPVPEQPRLLVTGERDGHVNLYDIETGECVQDTLTMKHLFRCSRAPIDNIETTDHSKLYGSVGNTIGVCTWSS